MTSDLRSRRWVILAVAVVCVTALVAAVLYARSDVDRLHYSKGEVHVYNLAAERMIAGEEIYRPQDHKPFTYPPFMALLFVPMACMPHYAVRPVWYAINFLIVGWILLRVAGLFRRAGMADASPNHVRWLFWIPTFVLAGRHVYSPIENQSNDLPILLLVVLGVYALSRDRDHRAGMMFGLGAATKATPLLFLPILLWKRRFGGAIAVLAAIAVAQLVTELAFARQDGQLWIFAWYQTFVSGIDAVGGNSGNSGNVGNAWSAWNVRNQNLASLVYRFSTPVGAYQNHTFDVSLWHLTGTALRSLTFACQLGVLGFIVWTLRPRRRGLSDGESVYVGLGEAGMVVCGMVLLSPMSSKSHFCVLLLPIAFCCYEYVHRERGWVLLGSLLVMLAVALTAKGIVGTDAGYQILARGSVTWGTLAAMVGTASVLGRVRRGRDSIA